MARYNLKHGITNTPFYNAWVNMKARCDNANKPDYHRYGGRGITYEPRWQTFGEFFDDMHASYKPGLSLDRIENSKPYSKENCRWATRYQQANNTRRNRLFTIDGITKTFSEWVRISGIKSSTARQRYYVYGWSIKRALGMDGQNG